MNNEKTLSKSAQNVQNALLAADIPANVTELPSSTRTANDAEKALNCEVAQIVKSLLFQSEFTSRPILILASGVNRVNESAIERLIGEKVVKANADFTREITGFAIGGIPPVGHKNKIDIIFIDEDLFGFNSLWAAAGTPNAVFSLSPSDLVKLTSGKIISIK